MNFSLPLFTGRPSLWAGWVQVEAHTFPLSAPRWNCAARASDSYAHIHNTPRAFIIILVRRVSSLLSRSPKEPGSKKKPRRATKQWRREAAALERFNIVRTPPGNCSRNELAWWNQVNWVSSGALLNENVYIYIWFVCRAEQRCARECVCSALAYSSDSRSFRIGWERARKTWLITIIEFSECGK